MKLHAVSLRALYKGGAKVIIVHVTGVSKDHGIGIWKLGWGEGKMDGEVNMITGEKEEGNVYCLTFLSTLASPL